MAGCVERIAPWCGAGAAAGRAHDAGNDDARRQFLQPGNDSASFHTCYTLIRRRRPSLALSLLL